MVIIHAYLLFDQIFLDQMPDNVCIMLEEEVFDDLMKVALKADEFCSNHKASQSATIAGAVTIQSLQQKLHLDHNTRTAVITSIETSISTTTCSK